MYRQKCETSALVTARVHLKYFFYLTFFCVIPLIPNEEQQKDFEKMKQILTEGPCLAHYAKDKDNIVTTDASTTGLGLTLWQKQDDGNIKLMHTVADI